MPHNLPDIAVAELGVGAAKFGCEFAMLAAFPMVESGGIRDEAERLAAHRFEPGVWKDLGGGLVASFDGAMRIDPERAMMASSHGAFQILGKWHAMFGYPSALEMRAGFIAGGWKEQVRCFLIYCEVNHMASPLRTLDIHALSRIYNGKGYARWGYHLKLSRAYAVASGKAPARVLRIDDDGPEVLALQKALTRAGFLTKEDRIFGPETEKSLRDFQRHRGLRVDGVVGAKTWAALEMAEAPEAQAPVPTQAELWWDRLARHRGKIVSAAGSVAAFWDELKAVAAGLGFNLGDALRRIDGGFASMTPERWALLALALLVLWPRFGPHLRRATSRIF